MGIQDFETSRIQTTEKISFRNNHCMFLLPMLLRGLSSASFVCRQRVPPFLYQCHSVLGQVSLSTRFLSSSSEDDTTITMTSDETDARLLGKLEVSLEDAMACHGSANVAFVDGSWWLPGMAGRATTSRQDFETRRIEGAHFFDIDDVAAVGEELNPKKLPHMMPEGKMFATAMDRMGISNQHHVIMYAHDSSCPFIHRTWFQMYAMGHDLARGTCWRVLFQIGNRRMSLWTSFPVPDRLHRIEQGRKSAVIR